MDVTLHNVAWSMLTMYVEFKWLIFRVILYRVLKLVKFIVLSQ